MASVASSIVVGCANLTENFSAWPECWLQTDGEGQSSQGTDWFVSLLPSYQEVAKPSKPFLKLENLKIL